MHMFFFNVSEMCVSTQTLIADGLYIIHFGMFLLFLTKLLKCDKQNRCNAAKFNSSRVRYNHKHTNTDRQYTKKYGNI